MTQDPTERSFHPAAPTTTDSRADSVLVVLDPDDPTVCLQAALRDTAAADVDLHVLLVFPTAEYERRRRARVDAGVPGPYTLDHLAEEARRIAERTARDCLGRDGPWFEAIGAVGRPRDRVAEAVREHDYSRVYVDAPDRTLWQRLLGEADLSGALARTLPDTVSVVTADSVTETGVDETDSDAGIDSPARHATRSRDT